MESFFDGQIKVLSNSDFKKLNISQASCQSVAKTLIPETFDHEANIDVLPVMFNLAVINEFNKNGDGIDAKTAVSVVKQFVNKPINIEHKKQNIVGHMINASFSKEKFDFNDNDIESFAEEEDVFYLNAAGLLYRNVFPELCEAIERSAEEGSEEYSTSWEVAFFEYSIARGSHELKNCEVIDDARAEAYHSDLKSQGGDGVDVLGTPVNRLLVGDIYPLGAGITCNPAARVSGVYTSDSLSKDAVLEEANKEKSSLNAKNNVKKEKFNNLNMTKQEFAELMEKVQEGLASQSDASDQAKSIAEIMTEAIADSSKEWKSKLDLEVEAKAKAEADLEALKQSFQSVQAELGEIKSQAEAKAAADLFNDRMSFIDEKYDFESGELEFVVAELKGLDSSDEKFEEFKAKVETLFAHKNKEVIAKAEKAKEKEIEEAVAARLEEQTKVSEPVAPKTSEIPTKEPEENKIPNNNAQASEKKTLLDRVSENFEVEVTA